MRRLLALGLVVATAVVVGSASPTAAATCDLTWGPDTGSEESWFTPTNWSPSGQPTSSQGVCIITSDTVALDVPLGVEVREVQLGGTATLDVRPGAGLFVNGADPIESVWTADTHTLATTSELGGTGTIRAQGSVTFTSSDEFGTFLTSVEDGGGDAPPADPGEMIVEGTATLANLGLGLLAGYHVEVADGGTVSLAPNAFFAADYGTSLTIADGGTFELTGDADYHQGFDVDGQELSLFTNNGTLVKSGTGASVVDAGYIQGATGQVVVQSGTLALPDDNLISAQMAPGTTFATGTCGAQTSSACQPTTDPTVDTMSVELTVPGANAGAASVQLQELAPVSVSTDPNGIGNEVLAHADGLTAGQAARIDLRFSQPDVMATPLDQVQVVHTPDVGSANQVIDCVGGAVPAGHDSCVLRPATRSAGNTFVSVLTETTSRWRLRRGQAVEQPTPAAASAPQGLTVKEAAPFDGSVLAAAWSPPASGGTSPVTSYRVALDGQVVATPTGTSVVLKNPGPGKHTLSVAALSAAGQGAEAVATVTVAALSMPRQVAEVRGAAGGKLTAGAKWKPPAEAGGFTVTKYKIAVFTSTGKKVETEIVTADKLKYLFRLKPGRYVFQVRARNTDRWGPWSKPTDVVRPR